MNWVGEKKKEQNKNQTQTNPEKKLFLLFKANPDLLTKLGLGIDYMISYAGGLEGVVVFRGGKGQGWVEGDVHQRWLWPDQEAELGAGEMLSLGQPWQWTGAMTQDPLRCAPTDTAAAVRSCGWMSAGDSSAAPVAACCC